MRLFFGMNFPRPNLKWCQEDYDRWIRSSLMVEVFWDFHLRRWVFCKWSGLWEHSKVIKVIGGSDRWWALPSRPFFSKRLSIFLNWESIFGLNTFLSDAKLLRRKHFWVELRSKKILATIVFRHCRPSTFPHANSWILLFHHTFHYSHHLTTL